MAVIAYALPIIPGQTDSARNFSGEVEAAGFREHYEELNRETGVTRHMEWVQSTPMGDLLVVFFETDAPDKLARKFVDDEYDRWWRARVERIHGFDPAVAGGLPEQVYSWSSGG
jgi:hypothetical protein